MLIIHFCQIVLEGFPDGGNYYSFCAALPQFSGESLVKRSRQFEVEGEHLCPHSQLSRTLDDEDVDLYIFWNIHLHFSITKLPQIIQDSSNIYPAGA